MFIVDGIKPFVVVHVPHKHQVHSIFMEELLQLVLSIHSLPEEVWDEFTVPDAVVVTVERSVHHHNQPRSGSSVLIGLFEVCNQPIILSLDSVAQKSQRQVAVELRGYADDVGGTCYQSYKTKIKINFFDLNWSERFTVPHTFLDDIVLAINWGTFSFSLCEFMCSTKQRKRYIWRNIQRYNQI